MEVVKWVGMPESQPIVTLSWEDIYYTAKSIAQEECKRNPTQEEIKELFDIMLHKGINMSDEVFRVTIKVYCQKYYDEVDK
jgi:hypothetical protein